MQKMHEKRGFIMSEERIYEDVTVEEAVTEENVTEEQNVYEMPEQAVPQEPVVAKKGFATAALVFGILAFITTLFVLNYVFGILALIFGIVYLVKKADVKPKGKAVAGIVLAAISLIISTTIWVSAYVYVTKTGITQIIEDVGALMGEEIDGRETVNQMVEEMTGNMMSLDTIEQFVGGEVSIERLLTFIGDVKEEEITTFMNKLSALDDASIQNLIAEFGGEVTYEKLEEKLGAGFSLRELIDYIENHISTVPQQ